MVTSEAPDTNTPLPSAIIWPLSISTANRAAYLTPIACSSPPSPIACPEIVMVSPSIEISGLSGRDKATYVDKSP